MVSIQSIIIPGIIIGIIGGITMFFGAYSYYPEKHLNVNLNGRCYEFVDAAFSDYEKLIVEKEILIKILQTKAIGDLTYEVPITFTGTKTQVSDFLNANLVKITEYHEQDHPNKSFDKILIKGTMRNSEIVGFLDEMNKTIVNTNARENLHNFGIQPNIYISKAESHQISQKLNHFMKDGLTSISYEQDGVENAECRTKIIYDDEDNQVS